MRRKCVQLVGTVLTSVVFSTMAGAQVSSLTGGHEPGCAAMTSQTSVSVLESKGDGCCPTCPPLVCVAQSHWAAGARCGSPAELGYSQ